MQSRTRDRDGLLLAESEQSLHVSSCSLLLLSQNVTSQRLWPPAAHAVPALAFCPKYCQQQALGQEVKSGAWDFLILE